jgi:hypothetical protein
MELFNMRDLVFKNLTSFDHRKRVVVSSEVADRQGVRSVIRRHMICLVREIQGSDVPRPAPFLSVLKKRDTRNQQEEFFCRVKGSIVAVSQGKMHLIIFMHTLRIMLSRVPKNLVEPGV